MCSFTILTNLCYTTFSKNMISFLVKTKSFWRSPDTILSMALEITTRVTRHVRPMSSDIFLFSSFLNYFVWLGITDEGSVPDMRIWSILLIESDLKWCIHSVEVSFYISLYLTPYKCSGKSITYRNIFIVSQSDVIHTEFAISKFYFTW